VVSVTARLEPLPRLVVAPTLLFTGRAVDYIYADDGSNPAGRSTPAGTVVNLTATWQAFDQAALFLEARNLGNSRFEPQNGFVTPGRSVLLGTRFAL
jgi:vitamin B12 transporter